MGSLCKEIGCKPAEGVEPRHFATLVSDTTVSGGDYHLDCETIEEILKNLGRGASARGADPRAGAISALFRKCDTDSNGRLRMSEMFTFAKLLDYPDSEQVFEDEYRELCKNEGINPDQGMDEQAFTHII